MKRAPELIAVRGRSAAVSTWLARRARAQRVTVLEGPRGVDPRRFGRAREESEWYVDAAGDCDPAGLGLCLAHLERVLLARSAGDPALLVGDDQGAALVLALACCWPERLAGVIAVGRGLPELPRDALARVPMRGLPVLAIDVPEPTVLELSARGARVAACAELDALDPWLRSLGS